MSNKTQLQSNNAKLQDLLNTALGLPTQESMKNGKYVWKKSKRGMDSVEVKGSYTTKTVPHGFLINMGKALFDSNKKYIGKPNDSNFPLGMEGVYILASLTNDTGGIIEGEAIYYISSHFQGNVYNVEMYNDYKINYTETFISYIVSNNEKEYPDKAVHSDGFYYEKVVAKKIAYGKVTLPNFINTNLKIEHGLGEVPKTYIVFLDSNRIGMGSSGRSYARAADMFSSYQNYSFTGSYDWIERYIVTHKVTAESIEFVSNGGYWTQGTYYWFASAE